MFKNSHKNQMQTMSVIQHMMRLYAHEVEAIEELEKCRVNPDFTSVFRDDLEFFIP